MKANLNGNLKGDEEPGVQATAQNLNFTISWAWSPILGLRRGVLASANQFSKIGSQSWGSAEGSCLRQTNFQN